MTPIFLARRHVLDNKPAHGAPCNRCGLCCLATACELGQHVFRRPAWNGSPCPGLIQTTDGSHLCQLAADPTPHVRKSRVLRFGITRLKNAARLIIGADDGCDARFNGEPRNLAFHTELERKDIERAAAIREARRVWGLPPLADRASR